MMSPLNVIDKYYSSNDKLRQVLLVHSWQVADMALKCAARHPEMPIDRNLVLRGALLHDIGIFETHAPSIHCNGTLPYLMHGFVGGNLLREMGLETEARICERHTGAGLSAEAVEAAHLSVPIMDYLPESLEEKLICYADKFYSKSHLHKVLTAQQAYEGLLKFGQEGASRFMEWHELFG